MVAAFLLSGGAGLGLAWLTDRLAPRRIPLRAAAALAWALAWTAVTRLWWLHAFYRAAAALLSYGTWPRSGAWALAAGWIFWALALSALLPGWRGRAAAREAAALRGPGRPPAPPPGPAPGPEAPSGTLLGSAAGPGGRPLPIVLTDAEANLHALLLGATGSGKTNALLLIAGSAIARGHPLVVLDGKGSDGLCARLDAMAAAAGRGFRAFTFRGRDHWNPCRDADPTRLRDLLAAIYAWDQPYYEAVARRTLGIVTAALAAAGRPATLRTVAELVQPDMRALRRLLAEVPDRALADRLLAPLDRPDEGTRSGIAGLAHRLGRLTETVVGPWLEPGPDPSAELDLLASASTPGAPVAHFSLDALDYPEAAADVGALVLQELQHVASALLRRGGAAPVYVVIDEFSAFRAPQVLALLNRGREAGLCCVLATQDLADIERSGGRTAVAQILANTATKLCLRLDLADTAARIAAGAGTVPAWRGSARIRDGAPTGEGSRERAEVPCLEPGLLLRLPPGEAVLLRKVPAASVTHVRLRRAPEPASAAGG